MKLISNHEHFDSVRAFAFSTTYAELYADSVENVDDSHIHEECEIYVNLSGDVSFVVENHIYPIKPGDIIITRPFEYHHCVYHSNKLHRHFWILFSSSGNEYLLDAFFNRKSGNANHLFLSPEDTDALISLCYKMTEEEPLQSRKYYNFFKLITILQNANAVKGNAVNYPSDTYYAIKYINSYFGNDISVYEIAKGAHVSVNTLERHFKRTLNISPYEYIKKKRLTNALKLLSNGCTVAEASSQSGFPDYSNFIALFKKTYGITPLKYKKNKHNL
ncbi:MAG: helix-turn-helix transcriptional regulator [Clostridia bacterium]|nr:helix-turn-helix transcriptional regulator [Clostridia bacterium]